ncbi:chromobox protein homolog 5-like [Lycorma delicatula]|uniref:chromobox protein homolog 5-like n=1 Tax=Lycorma delicatula TaxID=130591 RepID=UPI003F515B26
MNESFNEVDIEGILDRTIQQGKTYYLVKWEGLGYENAEWIRTERLSCWMVIKEFESNYRRWLGFECREDVDCDDVKLIPKPNPPFIDLGDDYSQSSSLNSFHECEVNRDDVKLILKPNPPFINLADDYSQSSSSRNLHECNVDILKINEAEYIKNHRNNCGTIEYLVKWKGLDEIENSWLTEEISSCFQDVVNDYWEKELIFKN